MLFSMQPRILSCGDLAILRGMRMLYRHREITAAVRNTGGAIRLTARWRACTCGRSRAARSRLTDPRQGESRG